MLVQYVADSLPRVRKKEHVLTKVLIRAFWKIKSNWIPVWKKGTFQKTQSRDTEVWRWKIWIVITSEWDHKSIIIIIIIIIIIEWSDLRKSLQRPLWRSEEPRNAIYWKTILLKKSPFSIQVFNCLVSFIFTTFPPNDRHFISCWSVCVTLFISCRSVQFDNKKKRTIKSFFTYHRAS